jgi:hypothetical protein
MPGMNEQRERALREGLKALADSTRDQRAGPRVEAAVLAAMKGTADRRIGADRSEGRAGGFFALAAAAALVIASASGAWLASRVERPGPAAVHPTGFVEIPGAAALPPIESGSIIRIALPIGALPQYGLAIPGDVVSGQVDAELLVAQDGVPRAIRLVRDDSLRSSAP